jgi:hypothetical protein
MWADGTSGKYGASLDFDGSDDYVVINDNDAIDFDYNKTFGVSAWIKVPASQPDTVGTVNSIVEKWSASGGYPYIIRVFNQTDATNPHKIYVARYDQTNNPQIISNSTVNDNQWHNVIFTKVGSTLYLYLDGKLEGTSSDSTNTTTTNSSGIYFGKRGSNTRYFAGQIDDVRIYNYSLLEDNVQNIYNDGVVKFD